MELTTFPMVRDGNLSDMLPSFSMNYKPDYMVADAVFSSKRALPFPFGAALADAFYVALCQLVATVVFASSWVVAILGNSVIYIVLVGTKKKMCWINAGRVVAFMQYTCAVIAITFGNGTKCKLPRYSMSRYGFSVNAQSSIAFRREAISPYPAIVRAAFIDFLPEADLNGTYRLKSGMMAVNKANGLAFDVTMTTARLFGDWSRLPAAAFAKFHKFQFELGRTWGIIHGVISSLLASGRPGTLVASPGISIGFLPVHYNIFSRVMEAHDVQDNSGA